MSIGIKHLNAFVTLAQERKFTRVAEQLGLSQPALTTIIQQLEAHIGTSLVHRTTRYVALTEAGEAFFAEAVAAVSTFDRAITSGIDYARGRRGSLRIAAAPSIISKVIPDTLAKFRNKYPDVTVHLFDDNARGVQKKVTGFEADIGISPLWQQDDMLELRSIAIDPYGVIFVDKHPLSGLNTVTLGHLEAFEFIAPGTDTGDWLTFCGLPAISERMRESKLVAHNSHALEAMLESGVGITIMPRFAAPKGRVRDLLFRPLTDMDAMRQVFTMRNRERPLSVQGRDFLDILKVTAAEVGLTQSA